MIGTLALLSISWTDHFDDFTNLLQHTQYVAKFWCEALEYVAVDEAIRDKTVPVKARDLVESIMIQQQQLITWKDREMVLRPVKTVIWLDRQWKDANKSLHGT